MVYGQLMQTVNSTAAGPRIAIVIQTPV